MMRDAPIQERSVALIAAVILQACVLSAIVMSQLFLSNSKVKYPGIRAITCF